MDKETKLQKLKSLVEEYVTYLDGYSEATMEVILKDKTLVEVKNKVVEYDEEKEIVERIAEQNIPLSEFIKITYNKPKVDKGYSFKSIEFPVTNIDKRIVHYRTKITNCKLRVNA